MKKNGSLIAAIIWAVCAVLWLIVTIFRIADGDSAWIIAINLVVFALSVVNVILNLHQERGLIIIKKMMRYYYLLK